MTKNHIGLNILFCWSEAEQIRLRKKVKFKIQILYTSCSVTCNSCIWAMFRICLRNWSFGWGEHFCPPTFFFFSQPMLRSHFTALWCFPTACSSHQAVRWPSHCLQTHALHDLTSVSQKKTAFPKLERGHQDVSTDLENIHTGAAVVFLSHANLIYCSLQFSL